MLFAKILDLVGILGFLLGGLGLLIILFLLFKKKALAIIGLGALIGLLFKVVGINVHSVADAVIVVGTILFTLVSFKLGKKMDLSDVHERGKEWKEWLNVILTWTIPFALVSAAIIWYTTGFLSVDILWQLAVRWTLRGLVIGLTVLYYGWPMFTRQWVVSVGDRVIREFDIAKGVNKVLRILPPGWYYYVPLVFGLHRGSAEVEKIEIPISRILSRKVRRNLRDKIMIDEVVLLVRYEVVSLLKLVPKLGKKLWKRREKAEHFVKDKAVSLFRAELATRNLDGTLEEWKKIEDDVRKEMKLFKDYGLRIVSVLISNLKIPDGAPKGKGNGTQETQDKQNNTNDDTGKDKPEKKGFTHVALGIIVVLFIAAITVPIVARSIHELRLSSAVRPPSTRTVERPKKFKVVEYTKKEEKRELVEQQTKEEQIKTMEVLVSPIEEGVTIPIEVKKGQLLTISATGKVDIGRGLIGPNGEHGYVDYTMDSPYKHNVGGLEMWIGPNKNDNRYFVGSYFSKRVDHSGDSITLRVVESLYGYHDGNTGEFKVTVSY